MNQANDELEVYYYELTPELLEQYTTGFIEREPDHEQVEVEESSEQPSEPQEEAVISVITTEPKPHKKNYDELEALGLPVGLDQPVDISLKTLINPKAWQIFISLLLSPRKLRAALDHDAIGPHVHLALLLLILFIISILVAAVTMSV